MTQSPGQIYTPIRDGTFDKVSILSQITKGSGEVSTFTAAKRFYKN